MVAAAEAAAVIVEPHPRRRAPVEVALVDERGLAVTERGRLLEVADLGSERVGYVWERTARRLALERKGELLTWCGAPIRYRPAGFTGARWPIGILALPELEAGVDSTLRSLADWRDWLGSHGARPFGTSGSTAWDLLRATLTVPLRVSGGQPPPLRGVLGGRQYTPAAPLRVSGPVYHYDVRAAYARVLAGTMYGGRWLEVDGYGRGGRSQWQVYGEAGYPTFVHCRIVVPAGLELGPLPRHPRGAWPTTPRATMMRTLVGVEYPVGSRMQGCWSYQELAVALELGCRLEQVFGAWSHVSRWRPFDRFWHAIEQGRELGGLAGTLAKVVGNSLWGQFAIRDGGERRVTAYDERGRPVVLETRQVGGGRPRAFDLAEHVTSAVRAMLARQIILLGVQTVVCAHTDGLWSTRLEPELEAGRWWRLKEQADELRVLHAQAFAGHTDDAWHYTFAGVPIVDRESTFENQWERACRRRGGEPLYWSA